jgi:hypothetical protein
MSTTTTHTPERAAFARMILDANRKDDRLRSTTRRASEAGVPASDLSSRWRAVHENGVRLQALCEAYEVAYGVVASPVELREATK